MVPIHHHGILASLCTTSSNKYFDIHTTKKAYYYMLEVLCQDSTEWKMNHGYSCFYTENYTWRGPRKPHTQREVTILFLSTFANWVYHSFPPYSLNEHYYTSMEHSQLLVSDSLNGTFVIRCSANPSHLIEHSTTVLVAPQSHHDANGTP